MIDTNDFRGADGQIDYKAWNEAYQKDREDRKNRGEICRRCGRMPLYPKGVPHECPGCKALEGRREVMHSEEIRCPGCGHHWSVWDGEYYELLQEGEHKVECEECNQTFEVSTSVSYSFKSPERLSKEESA